MVSNICGTMLAAHQTGSVPTSPPFTLELLTGESLAQAILRIFANDDAYPAEKLIDN
jgi:hypothetical protein